MRMAPPVAGRITHDRPLWGDPISPMWRDLLACGGPMAFWRVEWTGPMGRERSRKPEARSQRSKKRSSATEITENTEERPRLCDLCALCGYQVDRLMESEPPSPAPPPEEKPPRLVGGVGLLRRLRLAGDRALAGVEGALLLLERGLLARELGHGRREASLGLGELGSLLGESRVDALADDLVEPLASRLELAASLGEPRALLEGRLRRELEGGLDLAGHVLAILLESGPIGREAFPILLDLDAVGGDALARALELLAGGPGRLLERHGEPAPEGAGLVGELRALLGDPGPVGGELVAESGHPGAFARQVGARFGELLLDLAGDERGEIGPVGLELLLLPGERGPLGVDGVEVREEVGPFFGEGLVHALLDRLALAGERGLLLGDLPARGVALRLEGGALG